MIKKIKVEIYNSDLTVLIENNAKIAHKWIEKNNGEIPPKYAVGACYTPKNGCPFIWIKSLKNIPHLCHEITHACYGILENRGVTVDAENHEALTYLQTFLLKRVLK